jgi:hypothetical protein
MEVNRATIRDAMMKLPPAEEAKLTILRGDERTEIPVTPKVRRRATCKLRRAETPTDDQRRLLDSWLGRSRDF